MVFVSGAAAVAGAKAAAAAAAPYAGAGAAATTSLFSYNRKNFMYDRKMRQETEYQVMDFRIKQAELWREDVRDIIGLTSVKMDTYLIVNAVLLGFCVMAFCEGRLAAGTPSWLIGCHTLSLAGAFMYLLMAVWLAMHASVTAKSYEVRLMTQYVRLPMPTWAQLEGARTYGSAYEKLEPKQMFRVPFVQSQESVLKSSRPKDPREAGQEAGTAAAVAEEPAAPLAIADGEAAPDVETNDGDDTVQTADLWGFEGRGDKIYELDGAIRTDPGRLRHLKLVREAMQYWQSYDAFARVSMSLGTNQLILALSYYVLGYVLISNHAVVAAWLAVVLFLAVAAALIRLDMSLTGLEYRISVVLISAGPSITSLACEQWARHTPSGIDFANIAMPFVYALNALWLMFLLQISKVSEQKGGALLPTGFRSVMYMDVFGWIRRSQAQRRPNSASQPVITAGVGGSTQTPAPQAAIEPGAGPAMQAISYDAGTGRPVPARPEELPGAADSGGIEVKREDFEPTTFVPREKEQSREGSAAIQPHLRPGMVPWRIFCSATVLLMSLWWVVGMLVLLSSTGSDLLKVMPLLREPEETESSSSSLLQVASASELLGGVRVATFWPSSSVHPNGLACGGDDERGWLVATSSFGLFSTKMQHGEDSLQFEMAPVCDDIEGESLQDVALRCDGESCSALVLHRQGQRLTACPVSEGSAAARVSAPTLLAATWLGEADASRTAPQEEISSIALAKSCRDSEDSDDLCAFVETTARRIVEVQARHQTESSKGGWFPARVLRSEADDAQHDSLDMDDDLKSVPVSSSGALSVLTGQHLGVLRPGGEFLEAVDARTGSMAGEWQLPAGKRWAAMCGLGSSLYLMTEGMAPQLWRFPLPQALRAQPGAQAQTEQEEEPESTAVESDEAGLAKARNSRNQAFLQTASA